MTLETNSSLTYHIVSGLSANLSSLLTLPISFSKDTLLCSLRVFLVCYLISFVSYALLQQARTIVLHEDEEEDIITGCRQKTRYGRPEWNKIFSSIARSHPRLVTSDLRVIIVGKRPCVGPVHIESFVLDSRCTQCSGERKSA